MVLGETLLALALCLFISMKVFRENGSGWSRSALFLFIFPFVWLILVVVLNAGQGFGVAIAFSLALMMFIVMAPLSLVLFWAHWLTKPALQIADPLSVHGRCKVCTSPNPPSNAHCTECGASLTEGN